VAFEPTLPTAGRVQVLLAAMAALDRPCLLVIDNANELADLEANYQHLRRCSNFHLLLTTRITEFAQAAQYRIEGLPEDEALDLFRKHYPQHRPDEDALFRQIRTAVGGNTLVLELLAKNLRRFHGIRAHYTLATLLADLQSRGLLALSQSKAVLTDYQSRDGLMRHERPEDIIAAMYDLGELAAAETALLSAFAALPPESIPFNLLETLLKLDQRVVGLDNYATGHRRNLSEVQGMVSAQQWARFTFLEGDIRSLEDCQRACAGVDHVLHHAKAGPDDRWAQIAVGLLAVSEGVMLLHDTDHAILKASFPIYDALYANLHAHALVKEKGLQIPDFQGLGPTLPTRFLRQVLNGPD
jgi:hypothetical protein